MTQKVIFLDVDGTLVDYDNVIPESAIKAIKKLVKTDTWFMYVLVEAELKCQK